MKGGNGYGSAFLQDLRFPFVPKPEHRFKSCVRLAEHKLRPSAQRTSSPFFFYLPPAFLEVDKERKARDRWKCEKRGRGRKEGEGRGRMSGGLLRLKRRGSDSCPLR